VRSGLEPELKVQLFFSTISYDARVKLNPAQFSKNYVALVRDRVQHAPPREDAFDIGDDPVDLNSRFGQAKACEGYLPLDVGTEEHFEKAGTRALLVRNATLALSAAGMGSAAASIAVESARQMLTPELEKAVVSEGHEEKLAETPIHSDPEMRRDAAAWFEDIKRVSQRPQMKVFVVQGDSDNAACIGDNIYLNAGLVFAGPEQTKAVMSHEVGHSINKDFLVPMAWEAMLESWAEFPQRQFVTLNHECEFRADRCQMELMARLGLDPEDDIQRIEKTEGGVTHPSGPERAEQMREHYQVYAP
jgi:hypothetical protein